MYIPFLDRAFERAWNRWVRRGIAELPPAEVGDLRPTLRHTTRYKASLVFFFLVLSSLCVAAWVRPDQFSDMNRWLFELVRLALLAVVFVGIFEVASAFRHRVEVTELQLVITSAIGRSDVLRLEDISLVIEQRARDRIIVMNRDRKKYTISSHLNGFASLEARLRSILPPDRWLAV